MGQIEHLLVRMRKGKWSKRKLIDAVFYLTDSGCKWRQLPDDFPPAFIVHSFYRRAKLSGLWDKILKHMVKVTRKNAGLPESPTASLIDSQNVQNASSSEQVDFDGGTSLASDKSSLDSRANFGVVKYPRRLSKNYEYTMSSAEAMVKIYHIHTLLNRL